MNKVGEMVESAVVLDVLDYRFAEQIWLTSYFKPSLKFIDCSFDILVVRLGVQMRVNLKLQQDQVQFSERGGYDISSWNFCVQFIIAFNIS